MTNFGIVSLRENESSGLRNADTPSLQSLPDWIVNFWFPFPDISFSGLREIVAENDHPIIDIAYFEINLIIKRSN